MKITIFNGSPKKDASDTMHITRAFVEGMSEVVDNDVNIMHVIDKHIEYCNGCLLCMKNGGKCIHNDDMAGILQEICLSDMLIFSFPLYSYAMPAHLKALIDRMISLTNKAIEKVDNHYVHECRQDFSHKHYVMICGCGFPNSSHNFEAMEQQFQMMFRNNNTIITVSEAPMFNAKEAAPVTEPFKDILRQAGREYALNGRILESTQKLIKIPMIPHDEYALICNNDV